MGHAVIKVTFPWTSKSLTKNFTIKVWCLVSDQPKSYLWCVFQSPFYYEDQVTYFEYVGIDWQDQVLQSNLIYVLHKRYNKRILVFTIAGLAGASYMSNMAGYNKSMDGSKIDPQAYDDHIKSANKSKNEANLSLVIMIASVGYAYYDGLLKFGNK